MYFIPAFQFWVWLVLPETKNATLEDMDRVFKSHTGAEDGAMLAQAQREVGLLDLIGRDVIDQGEMEKV